MSTALAAEAPQHMLDRLLEPVKDALTPEAARTLLSLRADAQTMARLEMWAERNTAGTITPEERSQYAAVVAALDVIGILQAKAQAALAATNGA
jgi:hypothetical protein